LKYGFETMILISDPHLDDATANESRWQIFSTLHTYLKQHGDQDIFILGDLTQKNNRFNGDMVNRLTSELLSLTYYGEVHILAGNHDLPLHGTPFWTVLNKLAGSRVHYYTDPTPLGDLILLPWTPDPEIDWAEILWGVYKAAFLHMTVPGALMENGMRSRGRSEFIFPKHLKLYSGDVHTPQTLSNGLVYVGAPHPMYYGDKFSGRFLELDDHYNIKAEINLNAPRKLVLEVSDLRDLAKVDVCGGDQVRVKLLLPPGGVTGWQEQQAGIMAWAAEAGVSITSLEAVVALGDRDANLSSGDTDPATILTSFAAAEGLSDEIMQVGLDLIAEVRGEVG
jgi:hypothetical protein